MKNEDRQNKKVVSLAEYKKRRGERCDETAEQESLLQQVSYHLVMAARAIANQQKRN